MLCSESGRTLDLVGQAGVCKLCGWRFDPKGLGYMPDHEPLEPDPWMDEPLTPEEEKAFEEAEKGIDVVPWE